MYIEPSMSHDGFPFCSALCHQGPRPFSFPLSFFSLSVYLDSYAYLHIFSRSMKVGDKQWPGVILRRSSNPSSVILSALLFLSPSCSRFAFVLPRVCHRFSSFFPHQSLSGYFLWRYRVRDETLRPRLIIGRVRCSFRGLERVSLG